MWAALAGVPAGLSLAWAVSRLGDMPPTHFPRDRWHHGPGRQGSARIGRDAFALGTLVTLGAVVLGATHPAEDGWTGWSQALLLYALVVALAVLDWRTLLVDIRLVALGISVRVLFLALWAPGDLWAMGAGLLAGTGFFHLLGMFYEVLRGRQGLGEGDAAVAGLLGAFVGWQGLLPMVGIAAALGLLVSVPWLLLTRRPATAPIPFVPYLGAAGMLVYLAQLHGWPLPWALGAAIAP